MTPGYPVGMAGPSLEGLLNPDLLIWAREQSRLDVETVAARLQQTPERLGEWERGVRLPTLNQLRTLADLYRRNVGVFFLKERPVNARRPVDYRRLEVSARATMPVVLANGIREAEAKRDAALDILLHLEEEPPLWDLRIEPGMTTAQAAAVITEKLGVTMDDRRKWKSQYEALNGWRAAVESLGVLVVQLSRVSMEDMRGCSLALFPMPVIILNGADSPTGRIFTLLHELTHLARAESGLCDLTEVGGLPADHEAVEALCNRVAGEVLVPASILLAMPVVRDARPDTEWDEGFLRAVARQFWVSREVVLRRLLDAGRTSREFYQGMRARYVEEYARIRAEQDGRVPYYRMVLLSNGRLLTRLAVDAYSTSAITGSELSRILNAKLDHLPRIREALSEVIA